MATSGAFEQTILDIATENVRRGQAGGYSDTDIDIVNAVLDEISDALAAGNRVELRGFGAFSVKNRPSRSGRNPRTGDSVFVEEKWVPFFKTGKELRERLNPNHADDDAD